MKSRKPYQPMLALLLFLAAGCQNNQNMGIPTYPVTVIPPEASAPPRPPTATSPAVSPTADWSNVTLLPLPTPNGNSPTAEPAGTLPSPIPDPLTDEHSDLLIPARWPFALSDAELSLGRLALPVDLLNAAGPFAVRSLAVETEPGWRFLAFDLPLPSTADELGPVVRAPIPGEVLAGTMQMVNDLTVLTVSVDHRLSEGQLLRATFVFSGTIQPLFASGQKVQAGEALFRLTRDTGRLETLGSTPIPGGAVLTLHAAIDTVVVQPSGVESLKFLRGVSLTPAGFLRDDEGLILSPAD